MDPLPPLRPRPDVMAFLSTRRSRPAKSLALPAPNRAALAPMLEAALRVPDHGKLEPWRLAVLTGGALARLADATGRHGAARGLDPERVAKAQAMFADAPCIVAVIAAPVLSEKVPAGEQVLSAGAVCLGLVNAALASGWGATWLTGWMATDAVLLAETLGLAPSEFVAGWIVIGTETVPPPDRPRPDVSAKIAWLDA